MKLLIHDLLLMGDNNLRLEKYKNKILKAFGIETTLDGQWDIYDAEGLVLHWDGQDPFGQRLMDTAFRRRIPIFEVLEAGDYEPKDTRYIRRLPTLNQKK